MATIDTKSIEKWLKLQEPATLATSKQIKHEDLVQFMNIFASEFNSDSFHDRVLVFEIIEEPERASEPENETKHSGDSQVSKGESEQQTLIDSAPTSNGMVYV
jgi:hypothetical protein